MKLTTVIMVTSTIFFSQSVIASDDGEHLYKTYCDVCHGMTGGMEMQKRIAPPIAAVRMHYIGRNPDEASFVSAVSGWVAKQDPAKSLMRGAIRRFNIMPPIPVKPEDARKIAQYIYSGKLEVPAGMREHVQQEHNKRGIK